MAWWGCRDAFGEEDGMSRIHIFAMMMMMMIDQSINQSNNQFPPFLLSHCVWGFLVVFQSIQKFVASLPTQSFMCAGTRDALHHDLPKGEDGTVCLPRGRTQITSSSLWGLGAFRPNLSQGKEDIGWRRMVTLISRPLHFAIRFDRDRGWVREVHQRCETCQV